jgi:hypothetical protein
MADLLQQLENNEAILWMYLADELGAEDRAEVDRMLATDPMLRQLVDDLRAADQFLRDRVRAVDAELPQADIVARRTALAMQRRRIELLVRPKPAPAPVAKYRWPWWSYPVAAAAAAGLVYLVWWGHQPIEPTPVPKSPNVVFNPTREAEEVAIARLSSVLGDAEEADEAPLSEAERHLAALIGENGSGSMPVP